MATAYDTASIIIPQGGGYKAGSLYGWNPQDSSLVDFSVTRAGATATRVNSSGLIESVSANVARWDWAEGDSCPSLLIEPQRTNLLLYSEDFSNAAWAKTQSTLTPNTEVAPDGTTTASTLTATGNFAELTESILGTISTDYTVSFWLKRKTGTGNIAIKAANNILTIVSVTDDWQRFSVTANSTSTTIIAAVRILTNGDEVYVWGGQLEEASYVSSYIPTNGTTETRNADVISKTAIASLLGDSEGTLFAEFSAFLPSANFITLSDGTVNNRVLLGFTFGTGTIRGIVTSGGASQFDFIGSAAVANTYYKFGIRYSPNDFALYVDGSSIGTDSSGSTFADATLTTIRFTEGPAPSSPFYGRIRSLAVYDIALTNTELANLTT